MIKTGLITVKSIENQEIIIAMKKIIITNVMMKIVTVIRIRMRIKIGNCIQIWKRWNSIKK